VADFERVEKGRETYLAEVGCIQRDFVCREKDGGFADVPRVYFLLDIRLLCTSQVDVCQ
jgi:hypothetical protein